MARRTYTQDFKDSAARLVTEQGYSLAQAAKSLEQLAAQGNWNDVNGRVQALQQELDALEPLLKAQLPG